MFAIITFSSCGGDGKKDKDRDKNIAIESKGIMLFRLRQAPLLPISSNDIIHDKQILTKKIIDKLLLNLKPFVDKKHSIIK